MKDQLLTDPARVKITKQEPIFSEEIFTRLQSVPLIDKYSAYQLLSNRWDIISVDLEVIQTEGFGATKKVEPNMISKKVRGKDQEVQEGWMGRVMPFELVQETLLVNELQELKKKETRLAEIDSEITELFEVLSEEDKEADTVNEAKDSFINSAVTKEAKLLRADAKRAGSYDDDSYEAIIINVDDLISEQRKLNREVKSESAALHMKTKETIEGLSDDQVNQGSNGLHRWLIHNQLPEQCYNSWSTKFRHFREVFHHFADITDEIALANPVTSN